MMETYIKKHTHIHTHTFRMTAKSPHVMGESFPFLSSILSTHFISSPIFLWISSSIVMVGVFRAVPWNVSKPYSQNSSSGVKVTRSTASIWGKHY